MTSPVGPGAVEEVTRLFRAYEDAFRANDAEAMSASFAETAEVRRFGIADEQQGIDEIRVWRSAQPPPVPGRYLEAVDITAVTADVVVTAVRFGYGDGPATGRQTQVWRRAAEGWRIVHAHVSLDAGRLPAEPINHTHNLR